MSSDILQLAKSNFRQAISDPRRKALPEAGWRWNSYCVHARRQMHRFRDPLEVIHNIQSPHSNAGYEARYLGEYLVEHAKLMEKTCRDLFPEFAQHLSSFAETELSHPLTITELNGRLVSSPLYNHAIAIMRCVKFIRPKTILEIGGGYGAPGRQWLINSLHNPAVYIDVDFPESLFYAEVYFRLTMPDVEIIYLNSKADVQKIDANRGRQIILCPISNIEDLRDVQIDLVCNAGSLQEMSDEYVNFYMKNINSLKTRHFYSANYFAQRLNELFESMNITSTAMPPEWHALFSAYHGGPERGVAEIVYQRALPDSVVANKTTARLAALQKLETPPTHGSEFLELFECVREADVPDLHARAAAAAVAGMSYVPKEALWLARRAQTNEIGAAALLKALEELLKEGHKRSGIVDPTVAAIRDRLMISGEDSVYWDGSIRTGGEADEVEINGIGKTFRTNLTGAIERLEKQGSTVIIGGWAFDQNASEAVSKVHIFEDGALVESVAPSLQRPEFGQEGVPIGFHIEIALEKVESLRFIAEFADGSVGAMAQ